MRILLSESDIKKTIAEKYGVSCESVKIITTMYVPEKMVFGVEYHSDVTVEITMEGK